ncbi:hypothetical protein [Neobacillus sp. FSL H8-0543]|uniref:hypothetical protein n=1 Tax=Neobacillus sp. FSL H8-0543 TaxID=2954672 RepID=UPI003158D5C7
MTNIKIENILHKLIPAYIFLICLFGDYFDYYSRIVNELPLIIPELKYILDVLKLTIFILILLSMVIKKDFNIKIEGFFLFFSYIFSSFLVYFFSDEISLFGDFYYIEGVLSGEVAGTNLYFVFVYFMDLIILFTLGKVILHKDALKIKVYNVILWTIPFHLINALLQFKSFFGSWGIGALFFTATEGGNIPMRLTGLFNASFAFSAYLGIIIYIIFTKNLKYKYVYSIIILLFNIASLTRSGIIVFLILMIYYLFRNRSLKNIVVSLLMLIATLFTLICMYSLMIKYNIQYFARVFQGVNLDENFSLYFRLVAPFTNLYELISNNTFFSFFGLGHEQKLVSDNNVFVMIYKFGLIFTIIYFISFIKYSLKNTQKYFALLILFLLNNILFSGMGQFASIFFTIIFSLIFYEQKGEENEKNISSISK